MQVTHQLDRFALYEDYKALYDKVVPPVSAFGKTLEQLSTQCAQTTEVVKQLDSNLCEKAQKSEINEFITELGTLGKQEKFYQFKDYAERLFASNHTRLHSLEAKLSEQQEIQNEKHRKLAELLQFKLNHKLQKIL